MAVEDRVRLKSVVPLEAFRVKLCFSDGSERIQELEPLLEGPLFGPIRKDPALFRQVTVDPDFGGLEWPNGADVCPDLLRPEVAPASPEAGSR